MENEEEKVLTVENEGGKGNPNHKPAGSPEGGQFTSGPESGGDDDMGVIEVKEAPKSALGNAIASFIKQKKEIANKEAEDFKGKIGGEISEENKQFYAGLTREQRLALLYESPVGYDKKKLKFATDEQLTALLYAEALQNIYPQYLQKIELLKKRQEEIDNEIQSKLDENNIDAFSGIWAYSTKHPSDYAELKESGSIDKKREYYKSVLENPNSPLGERIKAKQFSAKLDEFEQLGQEYENLKSQLISEHLDEVEEIEGKIVDLQNKAKDYEPGSDIIELSKSYVDKFIDKNSAYSADRKNKALWFKSMESAYSHFSVMAKQHWGTMTSSERSAIEEYTGSGYSRFNKPLRKISHAYDGYSMDIFGTFSNGVNQLTNAIDKCTWDNDIWLNRFIKNNTNMFRLPGAKTARSLESMTDSELQSLVGTAFVDNGFMSCGSAKGTGYHTGSIIFNIYCPKGTHMAYVAPYSSASKSENEMIIQRGYEYRITKVERSGGRYYLDMEVVLGSDANKPVGNDLKKLGNEYYYKPRGQKGEDYD